METKRDTIERMISKRVHSLNLEMPPITLVPFRFVARYEEFEVRQADSVKNLS
jgi:hypothetical protein